MHTHFYFLTDCRKTDMIMKVTRDLSSLRLLSRLVHWKTAAYVCGVR